GDNDANTLTGDAFMSRSPSFGQLGRELFLSLVLVAFAAPAAFSQTSTGSIRGYVKDATGAPLSGATIEARNEQSGVARTATSQADGSYALPGLVQIGRASCREREE